MTTVLSKQQPPSAVAPWSIMPGWGVVADLTPPELIEMRRMKVLRKIVAGGLAAVLVLLVGIYVLAMLKASSAQDSLDSTRAEGERLSSRTGQYAEVTRVQDATDAINSQIAGVMKTDVDTAALVVRTVDALPPTMSISSLNVSLTPADAAAATTPTTATTANTVIGTVTLAGTSRELSDLADYVTNLQQLKGVTAVLPANNTAGANGAASWSMTFSLTDALHTHKYDAKPSGGN